MKRFAACLLAVFCAFPLLAATPSIIAEPTVMLFPFQVGGDADRAAGGRIALIIGNRIAELKNCRIKPAPPGTDRAHFLQTARDAGADYYVAGYVTPLGTEVSLVEQVVSAQSGIVVYSGTAQLRTYGESLAQGDVIDSAIIRHALRDIGNYQAPTSVSKAVPTPAPSASAGEADLGRLLRNRRSRGRATPSPSPSPQGATIAQESPPTLPSVPNRPGRGMPSPVAAPTASLPTVSPGTTRGAVALASPQLASIALGAVGGVGNAADRTYAADRLRRDLGRRLVVASLTSDPTRVCADHAGAIASATLATVQHNATVQATFELTVVRCDGRPAFRQTITRSGSLHSAIALATDAAVAKYLAQP